jgi:hypothetical protein
LEDYEINTHSFFGHSRIEQDRLSSTHFSAMENNSLLSVGKLCDEGYFVLFSISEVTTLDSNKKNLLKGSRDSNTGL